MPWNVANRQVPKTKLKATFYFDRGKNPKRKVVSQVLGTGIENTKSPQPREAVDSVSKAMSGSRVYVP